MFPIALKIGPVYISSFGVLLALGFILSLFIAYQECKDRVDISVEELFDTILLTSLGALIGARAFFILQHFSEFNNNILLMLLFRERPGLSYIGALVGSSIMLVLALRGKKISIGTFLDATIGSIGVFILFAQIGAFLDGFSFGKITTLPWGVSILGESVRRYPLPLFSVAGIFLFLIVLDKIKRSSRSKEWGTGGVFLLFLTLYSFLSAILNTLRNDTYMIGRVSIDVVFNLCCGILALLLFYRVTRSLKADTHSVLAFMKKTLHNIGRIGNNKFKVKN